MSPFCAITLLSVVLTIFMAQDASGMSRQAACEVLCGGGDSGESSGGAGWGGQQGSSYGTSGRRGSYCRARGGNCQPRGWCGTAKWEQADCDRASGQVCCKDRYYG